MLNKLKNESEKRKASIFSANSKMQSIVLNVEGFIIFTFIIYNRSYSSIRSQEKIIQRTISLHNAMQLSYFTSENARCYDKILHIYTCWHLGLTAAFSNIQKYVLPSSSCYHKLLPSSQNARSPRLSRPLIKNEWVIPQILLGGSAFIREMEDRFSYLSWHLGQL